MFFIVRLRPLDRRKVVQILEHNGFVLERIRKHATYKKRLEGGQVLITWVPLHNEISKEVVAAIISQTGKHREEFY